MASNNEMDLVLWDRETDRHTYTERALLDKVRRTEIHAINKGWVIFQRNFAKKYQATLTPFQFELDHSTSYIPLSFVLFLDCSSNYCDILYAHKLYECSWILQDHSCFKKSTTKSIEVLTSRLGNKHSNMPNSFLP